MTHDLLAEITAALGARVDRVVVTELRDGIYYADLVLVRDGDEIVVSARPSDSIALAARTGASISVLPAVLDEAGVEIRDEDEENEVARFRSFLQDVTPEDFGS
jgi:bifunctional DNase/RNase